MKKWLVSGVLVAGLVACDSGLPRGSNVEGRVTRIDEWPRACTFEKRVQVSFQYPAKGNWQYETVCMTRDQAKKLQVGGPIHITLP